VTFTSHDSTPGDDAVRESGYGLPTCGGVAVIWVTRDTPGLKRASANKKWSRDGMEFARIA
jgi:hypothetical protein